MAGWAARERAVRGRRGPLRVVGASGRASAPRAVRTRGAATGGAPRERVRTPGVRGPGSGVRVHATLRARSMRQQAQYRIQAVVEMTGVPAATLRMWERRYGLPAPERTAAAYRLYSDHDVALIRRVRELCDAGLAPAEAARTVLSLQDARRRFADLEQGAYDQAVERIVAAVQRFDVRALESSVQEAMFLGPATALFHRVLAPALRQIGERWHAGALSVGQEHLASEILGNAARLALRMAQPEQARGVAVLACFADEEHVAPLYGVGLRLAERGVRSVLLGVRTPPSAVGQAVLDLPADLVGLSVTIEPPSARLEELLAGYAAACGDTPWLVGGLAAPRMRAAIETHGGVVAPHEPGELGKLLDLLLPARGAGFPAAGRRRGETPDV